MKLLTEVTASLHGISQTLRGVKTLCGLIVGMPYVGIREMF